MRRRVGAAQVGERLEGLQATHDPGKVLTTAVLTPGQRAVLERILASGTFRRQP